MSLPVRNMMEVYVFDIIDEYLKNDPMVCQCDLCRNDMIAYALNQLPPKYVVTLEGEVWTKVKLLTPQNQTDVMTSLGKAINVIGKKRRHS